MVGGFGRVDLANVDFEGFDDAGELVEQEVVVCVGGVEEEHVEGVYDL